MWSVRYRYLLQPAQLANEQCGEGNVGCGRIDRVPNDGHCASRMLLLLHLERLLSGEDLHQVSWRPLCPARPDSSPYLLDSVNEEPLHARPGWPMT